MSISVAGCGGGGEPDITPPPVAVPVATIAIAPDSVVLFEGQPAPFTVKVKDSDGNTLSGRLVTWSVSDTTGASIVGSGASAQVTGLKPALVTVTATSERRTATARVLVRSIPASSVSLSVSNAQLIAGRVQAIGATTKDSLGRTLAGRPVTWSSDATSIATVSDAGLVTAVSPGTAHVTATSEGKSASATFVVTPATASATRHGSATVMEASASRPAWTGQPCTIPPVRQSRHGGWSLTRPTGR